MYAIRHLLRFPHEFNDIVTMQNSMNSAFDNFLLVTVLI